MPAGVWGGVMNKKTRIVFILGTGALLFLALLDFPTPRLWSQPKRIFVPPAVMGNVQVSFGVNQIAPCFMITVGGRRDTTSIARLDDRTNIPTNAAGNYCTSVRYPAITFNMPVKITMRSNIPGIWEAKAEGVVSALFEIMKPAFGQVISLGSIDNLTVQWRFTAGRVAIEKLDLYCADTDETFTYDLVAGRDYFKISKLTLHPDRRYQVALWAKVGKFKMKGPLDPSSYLEMLLHAYTEFRTTR